MPIKKKRRMFPHIVTIYNQIIETDKLTYKTKVTNYMTVLYGVLLDEVKAVNVRASGFEGADAVNLYIPIDVEAVDGITGEPKSYAGPMEWTHIVESSDTELLKSKWTMTLDGQGKGDTFFIKGKVIEPNMSIGDLSFICDGIYNITKVDEKRFGSRLDHWEVGGK